MKLLWRSRMAVALALLFAVSGVVAAPRTAVLPLSGMGEAGEAPVHWDFRIDAGRGADKWTRIRVPSCWEQEGFGTYYYGTQGRGKPDDDPIIPKERGEYRTEFVVPAEWRGQQVRIVFEAAMTDTTVRVNGQQAGATHQGGFYRFHYDITPLVRFGVRNMLEVAVEKESANASVNRAERRGDYWTFGGIYRPVWLEARPQHHIEWTAIDARADGSFYAQVHLGNGAPEGSSVHARIIDANGQQIGTELSSPVAIHGTAAVLTGKIDKPVTWSAETPHLYRVEFTLQGSGKALHQVSERFGFRTFEVRPRDGLYLNGRKIVLKGVNRHSFSPATGRTLTRENSYRDARLIEEANMNAVRMSHYPPDPHFLDAADELGLYVLDELAGWQGSYDTPTGARLIGQMIRRDVNRPSILFWDNGNEGGWNRENDGEFDRWDPQRRAVLHPWALHSGVNTDHYERYESTVRLSRGPARVTPLAGPAERASAAFGQTISPDIFMPTEFLHGLYDGGIGAGLRDYWDVMGSSPTVGGGFFWAFADEGIERTDRDGRIDNVGNAAADGIVGPHGEKEGSYYTVKEIWSPVQIRDLRLDRARSSLRMTLRNGYAFTSLDECTFSWQALKLPRPGDWSTGAEAIAKGKVAGPAISAGMQGVWEIPITTDQLGDANAIHLTARDPQGQELWTWSVPQLEPMPRHPPGTMSAERTVLSTGNGRSTVRSAPYELTFDTGDGQLIEARRNGALLALAVGPQLVAYRRVGRSFEEVPSAGRLRRLDLQPAKRAGETLATATYDGALRHVRWSRSGDALVMSYEIAFDGVIDILGVRFAVPETDVAAKRWVGKGPYRVWQNRLEGGVFGLHDVRYNDPIPGETYAYPEFKGYFSDWRWLSLQTSRGPVTIENGGAVPYFGLYRPQGGVSPLLDLPDVGWSFLHVIPAIGTKFDLPEVLGPQSQPRSVSGVQRGSLRFTFEEPVEEKGTQ